MLDIIRGQVFYIHYVWNQDAPIATQDMNETQHKADYVEKNKTRPWPEMITEKVKFDHLHSSEFNRRGFMMNSS